MMDTAYGTTTHACLDDDEDNKLLAKVALLVVTDFQLYNEHRRILRQKKTDLPHLTCPPTQPSPQYILAASLQ